MFVKRMVGPALLSLVLINAALVAPAGASASGTTHWRGHYVVYVQRRPYRRHFYRPYHHRRVVIVGPRYWRRHRVVYVYRRPYYYRRYYVRHDVR